MTKKREKFPREQTAIKETLKNFVLQGEYYLGCTPEKPSLGFPTKWDSNQPA